MNFNPCVWFEIYTDDFDRASRFYEEVLQVKLQDMSPPDGAAEGNLKMRTFPSNPEHGGAGGALCHMQGVKGGGGGTLVYFGCEDCATEAGRVEAAGGQLHRPKMAIGEYGFVALAVDTEGNMIGFHSMQ